MTPATSTAAFIPVASTKEAPTNPLLFSRDEMSSPTRFASITKGRYPGGEGDDEDPKDTRVARRTTSEGCMRGAAECTGMSPRFSMVVGQSDCYFLLFFLRFKRDVRMRDRWIAHTFYPCLFLFYFIFIFILFRYLYAIYSRLNYPNMHKIWTQESVINRKIGL